MDRISDLPDELLRHIILLLGSPHAAARTSLLCRRWRRVWAELISPKLVLKGSHQQPTNEFLDSVDAAVAGFSAPFVGRLDVEVPSSDAANVPALRVTPWLHFASQRLFGTLSLHVPWPAGYQAQEQEMELPACEGTTRIILNLPRSWRLQIQPTCSFTALSDLEITSVSMDRWVLENLASRQCRA
ncbi:hypothetical protein QOZ80_7BG0603300 [Eleusine coracana subsp. coracana]|nr:hypothetical protein QOZ80_7BG0603300 [Eleusine coracana subsp. coracana]